MANYAVATASPAVRNEYYQWATDEMFYQEGILRQREEAKNEGIEEGIGIGKGEGRLEASIVAIKKGLKDTVMVSAIGGFSEARARELIAQYAQK
ncbi:hypothetical protein AGMMS49992_33740 [Clostridia bacterium]|nr:hypothetical protein AGMMS49992_33740 [Clostridia bacterium]